MSTQAAGISSAKTFTATTKLPPESPIGPLLPRELWRSFRKSKVFYGMAPGHQRHEYIMKNVRAGTQEFIELEVPSLPVQTISAVRTALLFQLPTGATNHPCSAQLSPHVATCALILRKHISRDFRVISAFDTFLISTRKRRANVAPLTPFMTFYGDCGPFFFLLLCCHSTIKKTLALLTSWKLGNQ